MEGAVNEARRMILRLGRVRFGEPDAVVRTALQGITDLERLERLGERLVTVSSWQELFAEDFLLLT